MDITNTYRHFTTLVRGEDGKIYDLGKKQYLPTGVMAVNAWTEEIEKREVEIGL